jgi:hypothetical protein
MPVTESGRVLLNPYFRVDERGYVQLKAGVSILETGEVLFALPKPTVPVRPTGYALMTEIGTYVLGLAAITDETGQHSINVHPNPDFSFLTETGMHVIAPYAPFVDYFRASASQPANQTDSAPGTGWEIILYPEDKDADTFIVGS